VTAPVPPESLRPGGLPADDLYEPPFDPEVYDEALRWTAGELHAARGRSEDGTPRLASMDASGMVYAGAGPLTKVIECRCGQHAHGTIANSPAARECAAAAREREHDEPG
jgi:hypothetical protein